MFSSRRHGGGSSGSANQWLLLAGAGLVILAFVARMLLDIGHTRVSDITGAMLPGAKASGDSVAATASAPPADSGASKDTAVGMTATLKDTVAAPTRPVAAPVVPAARATPPALAAAGSYQVQLGAFGTEANADKLVTRATAAGFKAQVVPLTHGSGTLYAVRVGNLASDATARTAADSMSKQLGVNAVVIPPAR